MSTSQPQALQSPGQRRPHIAPEQLPPTLSVEQAAEIVGVGRNAAYRAAHSGDIPAFRVGRKLRVPTAALLRLLAVSENPPEGEQ